MLLLCWVATGSRLLSPTGYQGNTVTVRHTGASGSPVGQAASGEAHTGQGNTWVEREELGGGGSVATESHTPAAALSPLSQASLLSSGKASAKVTPIDVTAHEAKLTERDADQAPTTGTSTLGNTVLCCAFAQYGPPLTVLHECFCVVCSQVLRASYDSSVVFVHRTTATTAFLASLLIAGNH